MTRGHGRVFFGWRLVVTVSLVILVAGSVGRVASTSVGSDDEESLVDRDNDPLNLDISGFADSGSPSLEEEMLMARDPVDIYVGGFFPTSRNLTEGSIGRGVIPAVNLALKHINQSPDILRGYRLNIHWNNTQCDAAKGMKSFFDMMAQKNKKIMMLFGAACTSVTDPIAKTSRFFELVQLTYADTHPMYTSDNYPYFFRVVPSESSFNPARLALLQHFNWTRVGTLYQSSPRYALPHTKLLTDLDAAQISIGISESIGDELQDELQKLKTSNVRIILGSFDEDWARKIFCEAYHQGMYGRKYQWIIVSMYRERWWEYNLDATRCQLDEILEALEGYIGTDVLPLSTSENVTVSSLTPMEYEELYNETREGEYSRFHGYAYDGIWALAIAVQRILVKLKNLGNAWQLEEFQYRDVFWGRLFREALNETDFVGVTGLVNFVKNERRGLVLLKQLQAGEEVKIGEFDCTLSDLDLSKGSPILWRGGSGRPMDRTLSIQRKNRINLTIYTILVISAVCGIILAFVFLVVNIKYRNQRYIKMSSPYLNNMIIMGCILTYTSIILLGLDSGLTSENNFPYICAARAWVLMSGFTLAFGSMFSKTWRVHAIFTNIKLNKKVIKDYKLFMVVGVLVLIDVIILTTWQIVDPFYRETTNGTAIPSPENEDLEIIPEMEFCQSKKMTVFLGSIYAYKGLLMAFGCFLAWETRHVSIPALNDSKYVGMSVYNVVIMCSIGAAISFVLREQQDAAFIIISVFIIFCSTTTLCLVFVPKLVELRRNPQAGDKRVRATLKPLKQSRKNSDDLSLYGRIKLLQEENLRHRQTLEEKNLEIQALLMKLRETREPVIVISHEVTTIPEVTSPTPENSTTDREENSMDGKEDRSPVVEEQIQSRKYSAISLDIKPSLSAKKRVRIRTENSCPDLVSPTREERLSRARVDAVPRKGGSTGILNAANGAVDGTTAPKRCLSFLDQVSLVAKFVDTSESGSSGAESDSDDSQKSFLRDKTENGSGESNGTRGGGNGGGGNHRTAANGYAYQAPQQLESDDTSYARAIKNSHSRREFVNGLSSSAEEDTDRYDPGTHSEESDSSRPGHRRAKSLGTLRSPLTTTTSANGAALCAGETDRAVQAGGVSVIEGRRAEPALLPPLFPFFNRLVSEGTSAHRTGHQRDAASGGGVYSSFPSIKCDIVEYL